jgi:hypothetical protein
LVDVAFPQSAGELAHEPGQTATEARYGLVAVAFELFGCSLHRVGGALGAVGELPFRALELLDSPVARCRGDIRRTRYALIRSWFSHDESPLRD